MVAAVHHLRRRQAAREYAHARPGSLYTPSPPTQDTCTFTAPTHTPVPVSHWSLTGMPHPGSLAVAKLRGRLARFKKIAQTSTAEGERENAERLAEQAEAKLEQLLENE